MPLTYMQCRDTKCTPNKVMEKERAVYMQTLKRKCSQTYSACTANHYNGSRLKPMDDKQAKCSKKNCDHLIRFGGKTRRRRGLRERFGKP